MHDFVLGQVTRTADCVVMPSLYSVIFLASFGA